MTGRRVVVTGQGVVACNGHDVPSFWDSLTAGRHGIGPLTAFVDSAHGTRFGGAVQLTNNELAGGDNRQERRKDRYVLLAMKAAAEAMCSAGFESHAWADPLRVGVVIGSGIGGLSTIETEYRNFLERGPRRVSPFLVPKMIIDSAAGDISIVYGAKGPNYAIATACATASNCIGASFHHIKYGHAEIMLSGGCEAPITDLGLAGFNSIKALSTRNDDPGTASRPFDADREGFVIAEGAGILILEELEHAKRRGAEILAEIVGYGTTGDAHHETAPDPEGIAGAACMRLCLQEAGITPEQLGYLNAHGTSTRFNDKTETAIIKQVFGAHAASLPVSSTKGMTGHALGAAGGLEAIACIQALRDGILPPTINYQTPDPECDLDYVPNQARELRIDYALSNNLGFGGHNASLIFKRFTG